MLVKLTIIDGAASGRTFTFDQADCFLFGRGKDSRVQLGGDKWLSRHHFLLEIAPPSCKITDLDSMNGLFVNDIRYGGKSPGKAGVKQAPGGVKETRIKHGDEIVCGKTRIKVEIEAGIDGGEASEEVEGFHSTLNPTETFALPPGQTDIPGAPLIPGYRIKRELGRGGMGVVYMATALNGETVVAIKTMLPHMAVHQENMRAFLRETSIARQLNHPNVVRQLDHGCVDQVFFAVLEFVDGLDLATLIKERGGRLAVEEAAPVMVGALAGLAYAHEATVTTELKGGTMRSFNGVVHRDLKPQNIMLAKQGKGWTPKIVDFGLAKSFEAAGLTNMTMPDQVGGTPLYWPREQITHYRFLFPATDVFSMAATFYAMLTGQYVRDGFQEMLAMCRKQGHRPGLADFMRVIGGNPTVPIRKRDKNIPAPIAEVLDRALVEVDMPFDEEMTRSALASERYPHAGAFRSALLQALEKAGFAQGELK